ncbi:MAG: hypothetical protein ACXV8A_05125 [Chthoniobacterales bacterium]
MTMRILLAGILGGVAMFFWSFIAHMVLPLGYVGISGMPNESAVTAAMKASIGDRAGFYIFPAGGAGPDASKEEREAAMKSVAADYENQPTGILVYRPAGARSFAFGKWLCREFIFEVVESLLAVYLLAQAGIASFAKRVLFVTIVGVVAAITTNMSYWNWYGFPKIYTMGYMTTQVVGFLCAGIVAALIIKNTPSRTT